MTPRSFPIAAVIPAAGAGTRFGEPKASALLPDGRRFLDAVCETALIAGCRPVIAVVGPDVQVPAGVERVVNANPKSEQITTVRLGITRLANTPCVGALLWPVDHPFVELLSVLAVLDAAQRAGAPIVLPTFEGARGHPAFFHRDTWRELLTVADGGARAVVHSYGARVFELPVPDRGVRRDIDTKDDLARA